MPNSTSLEPDSRRRRPKRRSRAAVGISRLITALCMVFTACYDRVLAPAVGDGLLHVAAGIGGLKIVDVER